MFKLDIDSKPNIENFASDSFFFVFLNQFKYAKVGRDLRFLSFSNDYKLNK